MKNVELEMLIRNVFEHPGEELIPSRDRFQSRLHVACQYIRLCDHVKGLQEITLFLPANATTSGSWHDAKWAARSSKNHVWKPCAIEYR